MQRHSSLTSLTALPPTVDSQHQMTSTGKAALPKQEAQASTESKGPKSAFSSRRDHTDTVQHTKPFFGYSDDKGETLTSYSELPSRLGTSPKLLMLQLSQLVNGNGTSYLPTPLQRCTQGTLSVTGPQRPINVALHVL